MPTDRENLCRRNDAIREKFDELSRVTEFGERKYSYRWMCAKIAHEFFLKPRTVESILNGFNGRQEVA